MGKEADGEGSSFGRDCPTRAKMAAIDSSPSVSSTLGCPSTDFSADNSRSTAFSSATSSCVGVSAPGSTTAVDVLAPSVPPPLAALRWASCHALCCFDFSPVGASGFLAFRVGFGRGRSLRSGCSCLGFSPTDFLRLGGGGGGSLNSRPERVRRPRITGASSRRIRRE